MKIDLLLNWVKTVTKIHRGMNFRCTRVLSSLLLLFFFFTKPPHFLFTNNFLKGTSFYVTLVSFFCIRRTNQDWLTYCVTIIHIEPKADNLLTKRVLAIQTGNLLFLLRHQNYNMLLRYPSYLICFNNPSSRS